MGEHEEDDVEQGECSKFENDVGNCGVVGDGGVDGDGGIGGAGARPAPE